MIFQISSVIICLSYILGLLLTAVPGGGFWMVVLGVLGAAIFARIRVISRKKQQKSHPLSKPQTGLHLTPPHPKIFLIAGVVGLLATLYFQFRLPQPGSNDISKFIPENSNNQEQLLIVRGHVASTPRVTRSQRGQFWLEAEQLDEVKDGESEDNASKGVTGKVYVTVPLLQATGLYPGQQITITGTLYQPKPAQNPGAFDFQKYLQQQGSFAGFSGRLVNVLDKERQWGWWEVRQKIMRSHAGGLGIPQGPLVSAMVLGSKAVDLPYDIRDLFIKAGLAHTIAASGFHTSLVLGLVLGLTKRASRSTQFILGSLALIIFLSLTGFQPSVLRAAIMGFAALLGIGLGRKVKQLGSLLIAGVILLLVNPLWIWNLGFQLSFLATLGLVVTVPPLTERLQWLPPTIASLIAVPLAATIWTLPLQLFVFGVVPTYSIILNVIVTPLIVIISIGGIISAIAALILPLAGTAIASMLNYPTGWLINIVGFFTNLPGNSVAIGKIGIWQISVIYTLIVLVWLVRWWQKRWWFAGLLAFCLVILPIWHSVNSLMQVTVLATGEEPVLIVQDKGKITVVNSGDEGTGRFTIVPFLQQQGVNQIDWAISTDFQSSDGNTWLEILPKLPIKVFFDYSPPTENALTTRKIRQQLPLQKGIYQPLGVGQTIKTDSVVAQLINSELPLLQMQIRDQFWLLVGNQKPSTLRQLIERGGLPRPQVLWHSGRYLKELVIALQPQVAIATNNNLDSEDLSELQQTQTKLFFTKQDGAIQWTPKGEFESFIQTEENRSSLL